MVWVAIVIATRVRDCGAKRSSKKQAGGRTGGRLLTFGLRLHEKSDLDVSFLSTLGCMMQLGPKKAVVHCELLSDRFRIPAVVSPLGGPTFGLAAPRIHTLRYAATEAVLVFIGWKKRSIRQRLRHITTRLRVPPEHKDLRIAVVQTANSETSTSKIGSGASTIALP